MSDDSLEAVEHSRLRMADPRYLPEREFFIDNLLARIHFIIEVIWWTGLAPWEPQPLAAIEGTGDVRLPCCPLLPARQARHTRSGAGWNNSETCCGTGHWYESTPVVLTACLASVAGSLHHPYTRQGRRLVYHSTLGLRVIKKKKTGRLMKARARALQRARPGVLARRVAQDLQGRCKATWKREFKLPWREAGPPNHLNDKVDSGQ